MPVIYSTLLNPWFLIGIIVIGFAYLFVDKNHRLARITALRRLTPKRSATPTLDSFGVDFTLLARSGRIDPVVGREDQIVRLAQVLSRRNKNNAILIGAPGVGKTAIVEGLAVLIVKNEVPEALSGKRLLALNVPDLLAGTKYRGDFEQRAKKIVQEISAANRNVILFIDEVHSVIQSHGTEGAVNFADILKPALARGELQMIGATTTDEYNKYIKSDPSLERRFQPIEVKEPSEAETLRILQGVKDKYREYHKVEFTDAALEAAVGLTKKIILERRLPDKAIDAIDEAAAMVKVSNIHTAIPAILEQTAAMKQPKVAKLWKDIQAIDARALRLKNASARRGLQRKREAAEAAIAGFGIVAVDSDDIRRVVAGWTMI